MSASLGAAVIGAEDLDTSLRFYRDHLGLDASDPVTWEGPTFSGYFHLNAGATARVAECGFGGSPVGRVRLVEFEGVDRQFIRTAEIRRFAGLWNLNAYTYDILEAWQRLTPHGYRFWSEPVRHQLAASTGSPTEVVFEGPDGVPINLVELPDSPGTRVGEMRRYLDQHGVTSAGFTEVVTSAHTVGDLATAVAFHVEVLGMEPIIDEVMRSPEASRFLGLPEEAANHIVFLKGDHMFGKVVLIQPLNYTVDDLVPRAVPPNVGYLAMSFEVDDLDRVERACAERQVEVWSSRQEVDLPLLDRRERMIIRCPGSGALIELAAN